VKDGFLFPHFCFHNRLFPGEQSTSGLLGLAKVLDAKITMKCSCHIVWGLSLARHNTSQQNRGVLLSEGVVQFPVEILVPLESQVAGRLIRNYGCQIQNGFFQNGSLQIQALEEV